MTADSSLLNREAWKNHIVRAGLHCHCSTDVPDPDKHRKPCRAMALRAASSGTPETYWSAAA